MNTKLVNKLVYAVPKMDLFIEYILFTSEVSPSIVSFKLIITMLFIRKSVILDFHICFLTSYPSNIFVLTFDTNGWEETLTAGCFSSGAFSNQCYCVQVQERILLFQCSLEGTTH